MMVAGGRWFASLSTHATEEITFVAHQPLLIPWKPTRRLQKHSVLIWGKMDRTLILKTGYMCTAVLAGQLGQYYFCAQTITGELSPCFLVRDKIVTLWRSPVYRNIHRWMASVSPSAFGLRRYRCHSPVYICVPRTPSRSNWYNFLTRLTEQPFPHALNIGGFSPVRFLLGELKCHFE